MVQIALVVAILSSGALGASLAVASGVGPAVVGGGDGDDAGATSTGAGSTSFQTATLDDAIGIPIDVTAQGGIVGWHVEAAVKYPGGRTSEPAFMAGIYRGGELAISHPVSFSFADTAAVVNVNGARFGATFEGDIGDGTVIMDAAFGTVVQPGAAWFVFTAPGARRIDLSVELFFLDGPMVFTFGTVSAATGMFFTAEDFDAPAHARVATFGIEAHGGTLLSKTLTPADRLFVDWRFGHVTGAYDFRASGSGVSESESFRGTQFTHAPPHLDGRGVTAPGAVTLRFDDVATLDFIEDTFIFVGFDLPIP